MLAARTLPKTILAVVAVIGAIVALCIVPASFRIQGKGKLQPVVRRDVSASVEGTVVKVNVNHGDTVKKGQVLAELQNPDLDVEDRRGRGLAQPGERRSGVGICADDRDQEDIKSDPQHNRRLKKKPSSPRTKARRKKKIIGLQAKLKILLGKRERLKITSPIDGQVTTWDVANLLEGRTVQPGQVLMSVSDPSGEWELEVLMPEEHMGYIARAQRELGHNDLETTYMLGQRSVATGTKARSSDVHLAAEVRGEEGNTVLVHVAIDKHDLKELNQGAGVRPRVYCGKRAVGFVWFHDLIEFIQSRRLVPHVRSVESGATAASSDRPGSRCGSTQGPNLRMSHGTAREFVHAACRIARLRISCWRLATAGVGRSR